MIAAPSGECGEPPPKKKRFTTTSLGCRNHFSQMIKNMPVSHFMVCLHALLRCLPKYPLLKALQGEKIWHLSWLLIEIQEVGQRGTACQSVSQSRWTPRVMRHFESAESHATQHVPRVVPSLPQNPVGGAGGLFFVSTAMAICSVWPFKEAMEHDKRC